MAQESADQEALGLSVELPSSPQRSFQDGGTDDEEQPPHGQGSKPSPHEEKSQERKLRGRSSIARAESESSCDGVSSRKRTISSEDSSHTGTGSCVQELSVTLQKKAKPSDDGNDRGIQEAHAEPRRGSSRARSGHKRRRRSRSPADHPPPLRKSLVTSLRSLSEAIYEDLARVQAQQAQFPLTQEQLFALSQLRGPLCSAMQNCYELASQAAWAFPAQGCSSRPRPLPPPRPRPGPRPWSTCLLSSRGHLLRAPPRRGKASPLLSRKNLRHTGHQTNLVLGSPHGGH